MRSKMENLDCCNASSGSSCNNILCSSWRTRTQFGCKITPQIQKYFLERDSINFRKYLSAPLD